MKLGLWFLITFLLYVEIHNMALNTCLFVLFRGIQLSCWLKETAYVNIAWPVEYYRIANFNFDMIFTWSWWTHFKSSMLLMYCDILPTLQMVLSVKGDFKRGKKYS